MARISRHTTVFYWSNIVRDKVMREKKLRTSLSLLR
jgi:hypothetical protein